MAGTWSAVCRYLDVIPSVDGLLEGSAERNIAVVPPTETLVEAAGRAADKGLDLDTAVAAAVEDLAAFADQLPSGSFPLP